MFDFITAYFIKAKTRSEEGASAVEYGLLIAGIAALIAAIVFTLGGAIATLFQDMVDAIDGP